MKLLNIQLTSFRCFCHLEVSFEPDTTVFVAENGKGKTAILEGVSYLLGQFIRRFKGVPTPSAKDVDFREEWVVDEQGEMLTKSQCGPYMVLSALADFSEAGGAQEKVVAWDIIRARDKSDATVKLRKPETYGVKELWHQADWLIDSDNRGCPIPYPIIALYGTERAVPKKTVESGRTPHREFKRLEAYRDALSGNLSYRKMVEWLLYVEDHERRSVIDRKDLDFKSIERQTIQRAIATMLPGFSNLRTLDNPLRLAVDVEKDGIRRMCLVDQQLSDGYKIVLVLVLDIVSRILEANGALPQMTPEMLLASRGVVMIDEIDLHLHPSWQQHILTDLRRTFPNLQFIVTTHSPHVVSSVPREQVRIIDEGMVRRLQSPTQGVEVQELLRGVFGTHPAPLNVEIVGKLNRLVALTSEGKGDSDEWRSLYDELVGYYGESYGPLVGTVKHKEFLKRLQAERSDA